MTIETERTLQRVRVFNASKHLGQKTKDKARSAKNAVAQRVALVSNAVVGFVTGLRS